MWQSMRQLASHICKATECRPPGKQMVAGAPGKASPKMCQQPENLETVAWSLWVSMPLAWEEKHSTFGKIKTEVVQRRVTFSREFLPEGSSWMAKPSFMSHGKEGITVHMAAVALSSHFEARCEVRSPMAPACRTCNTLCGANPHPGAWERLCPFLASLKPFWVQWKECVRKHSLLLCRHGKC